MTNFKTFAQLLTKDLTENPNFNTEDETLHDFQGFPNIELGINREISEFGIYLAFASPNDDQFHQDLFNQWPTLIPVLKDYLDQLFTENTNNDPCSFSLEFITNHLTTSEDDIWEIRLTITDYYS